MIAVLDTHNHRRWPFWERLPQRGEGLSKIRELKGRELILVINHRAREYVSVNTDVDDREIITRTPYSYVLIEEKLGWIQSDKLIELK